MRTQPGWKAALCRNICEKLEILAKQAGVISLMNLFRACEEEMSGFLEEGEAEIELPDEKWLSAEEGLKTIAALLKALADAPSIEGPTLSAELKTVSAGP